MMDGQIGDVSMDVQIVLLTPMQLCHSLMSLIGTNFITRGSIGVGSYALIKGN